jgi:hypothetical protein
MPWPCAAGNKKYIDFLIVDKNGQAVDGATLWPVWLDGDGTPHSIAEMPYQVTMANEEGGGGRASMVYCDDKEVGTYGAEAHFYDGETLHTAVGGAEARSGAQVEVIITMESLDLSLFP